MTVLDEIRKRHALRVVITEEFRKIKPPVPTDSESFKDHKKILTEQQSALIDACFMVERDMQVVLLALHEAACGSVEVMEDCVRNAYAKQRLTDEEQQVLNRRQVEDAEAREKAAKAKGDVPGQMKLVRDDGSVAQEASAVTTRRIEQ